MMTRDEHVAWCKRRALEYCDHGDAKNGLVSMYSDLDKHPETRDHPGTMIGIQLELMGKLSSVEDARRFINGFN